MALLDDSLKAHFEGQKASELLDSVKKDLDAADSQQEAAVKRVPEETLKVYEAKGRVLELVEDLNRAAKNAFDGQAEIIGKFNKDVLLRARKSRAKPAAAPTP